MNIAVCVKQVPDTAIEREGSGALGMAGVGASSDASLKWVAPLIRRGFVSEACEVDGAGGVEGFLRGAGR